MPNILSKSGGIVIRGYRRVIGEVLSGPCVKRARPGVAKQSLAIGWVIFVMGTEPWKGDARVQEGDDYPAVNVSWYDAQDFLTRLSGIDDQNAYFLPNEEEWEYASRAGTTTKFSFGDDERDLRLYGWYRDMTQRGEEYAHQVGTKRPNPWGLYDMHGNVWEWTDNWYYGSYAATPKLDPIEKVLRGGGWDYPAYGARSSFRNHLLPSRSNYVIGLRLVRGS